MASDTWHRPSFQFPRLWHAFGWLLVILVVVLSLTPKPPNILEVPGSDKVNHLLAYLVLMLWFCQLYRDFRRQVWIGAGLFALGGCLELLQGLSMLRAGELADVAVNGCGVLVGWFLSKTPLGNSLTYLDGRLLRLAGRS